MSKTLPTTQVTLEHFLRSLSYRFKHITADAPDNFGSFEAPAGIRSPGAIVRHMAGLVNFAQSQLEGSPRTQLEPLSWSEELRRFEQSVQTLEQHLQQDLSPKGELELDQLWRGPLIDAMTHIGQLAMLRRLAGSPVEGVRYWQVEMPPLTNKPS